MSAAVRGSGPAEPMNPGARGDETLRLPSDQDASGRTLGAEELEALAAAIRSGTLTSTKGRFVRELEASFARWLGARHVYACSSGTAAVHAAVAALDPEPGDEIVSSPITDMGALTPILYQGAIPVFADVDPRTGNLSAATIADRLSSRTRAIVVTHLFGNPCEMGPILELARSHGLPVIEDCAQALGARYAGRRCGTLGAIGAFSLQQGKHITTGEGGLVATDDEALARRLFLFINKAWGYGDAQPDHDFLALNCRMSELQGAVGAAQLPKLESVVERRVALAARLGDRLQGLPGVETPWSGPAATPSYWRYALRVDPARLPGGPEAVARLIAQGEIAAAPRYIQKPAFRCRLFREQRTFGASRWPFTLARPEAVDYRTERFPGTFAALEQALVLPWNERMSEAQVDRIARTLREAALSLSGSERS